VKVNLSRKLPFAFLFVIFVICSLAQAQNPNERSCEFNFTDLSFKGTSLEQARCLLRKVKFQAKLEDQPLPVFLERIIDQNVQVTKEALRKYLRNKGIGENKIGGSLDDPISKGVSNTSNITARYFVIHDTSDPNLCKVTSFPADINEASWIWGRIKWNDPGSEHYTNSGQAHLYITRTGETVAPRGGTRVPQERTFNTPWRATSLEMTNVRSRGMFLHIENVQPRRCNDAWIVDGRCKIVQVRNKKGELERKCTNDNVAPDPGLTDAQLEKLALVYIAASVRRGKWMIPAFHAAVDKGISGAHDDPQNFDLQKWADKICLIVTALGAVCPGGGE